jgi:hypothetical protein
VSPLGSTVAATTVRKVAMPDATRARSTLARVDYEDAWLIPTGLAGRRSAEAWMRGLLDGAPESTRRSLRRAWLLLGFRLGPAADEQFIVGWEVRRAEANSVLVGSSSRIGMPAELVLERRDNALLMGTLVQHGNPLARAVWALVTPGHQRVVLHVLKRAKRRMDTTEQSR